MSDSNALLDETIRLWQPLTDRDLTREDARQMVENVTGFFRTLQRWQDKEAAEQKRAA